MLRVGMLLFFSKAHKTTGMHQRLCALRHLDLIVHLQLQSRKEAVEEQDLTGFDMPNLITT